MCLAKSMVMGWLKNCYSWEVFLAISMCRPYALHMEATRILYFNCGEEIAQEARNLV